MKPLADYTCLSKKCETPEGASVYELPIDSVCCPACGSKRIKRLFNRIAILKGAQPDGDARLTSHSRARRMDPIFQDMYDQRDANKSTVSTVNANDFAQKVSAVRVPGNLGKAVPMTATEIGVQMRQDMQRYGAPTSPAPVMTLMNRQPIPTRPLRSKDE